MTLVLLKMFARS